MKGWTAGSRLPGLVCPSGPELGAPLVARHMWRGVRWCAGLHCHIRSKRGQWSVLCGCGSPSGHCIAPNGVEILWFSRVWGGKFPHFLLLGGLSVELCLFFFLDRFQVYHVVNFLLDLLDLMLIYCGWISSKKWSHGFKAFGFGRIFSWCGVQIRLWLLHEFDALDRGHSLDIICIRDPDYPRSAGDQVRSFYVIQKQSSGLNFEWFEAF